MHPALLSLADIINSVHMKATSHLFTLTGYIPIPKWLNVSSEVATILTAHLYHACIDIITKNLKKAEAHGTKLSDPSGNAQTCHMPLILWICNLPEQHMQACVISSQSPVILTTTAQIGDKFPHPHHTCSHTLSLIKQVLQQMDPVLIPQFVKACQPSA